MATQGAIDELRLNIGDPGTDAEHTGAFWSDVQLGTLLDAVDGVEPRARVAALRPLVADAANATQFSDGDYSEHAEQRFAQLRKLLDDALAEVAILDEQDAATARGKARRPTLVRVQSWF
jgi:hypothetical protein